MKQTRSRHEPRRIGSSAMVVTMLLSFCVLTFIKARYCSTPYPHKPTPLLEVEIDDDYDGSRYKISGPICQDLTEYVRIRM